jgi:hypothetical protein
VYIRVHPWFHTGLDTRLPLGLLLVGVARGFTPRGPTSGHGSCRERSRSISRAVTRLPCISGWAAAPQWAGPHQPPATGHRPLNSGRSFIFDIRGSKPGHRPLRVRARLQPCRYSPLLISGRAAA